MTSWEDAFLILNKWRDDPEPPLIAVMKVGEWPDEQGQTTSIAGGVSVFIKETSVSGGTVTVDEAGLLSDIDLTGAVFEYSDSRDSPLVDGDWVCSLVATFPDGEILVFAEHPEV
ncbi:MAG: hypothetical protein ABSB87_09500 [Terriglobales bacterium]